MEKDKKMSVKDFIKQRKTQIKTIKRKQVQTDLITAFIDAQQLENFEKSFSELKNEEIIFYLFSEDSMKVTPLLKILLCQKLDKWLAIISSVISNSWIQIDEKICQQWNSNELIANDWKNKFTILNRGVVKLILGLSQKDRPIIADIIVKEFSSDHNFISELYVQYLSFGNVKQHFPMNIKVDENLLELASILDVFYIPFTNKMRQFVDFRNLLIKEYIWNKGNFIDAIKSNWINEYTFELKEMSHNFMHELVLQKNIKAIETAHQLLQYSQNLQHQKLLKKIYSSFRSDEETPIDIALQKWVFAEIQQLMKFIEKNPQTMRFSTNSLNFLLLNQCLNQFQKEQMIREILSEKFSQRGYIESVKLDKYVKKNLSSSQKPVQMHLETNEFSSVIIYDSYRLISKKYKKSYPLLFYLNQFRENSNLQIVERLFLKNLLSRKPSKFIIVSAIISFWRSQKSAIQQNSKGHKQIQEVLYYHTPLLYLISKMNPCDCIQYLIDKMFLNCPQIYFKKLNDGLLEVVIGRHFLLIYLENCQTLSENSQNNAILEKIFLSKESEKLIRSKYNFYVEVLKALNRSSVFTKSKNQFYMTRQIRFYLRQYFDTLPVQQLFKSDYFMELSWEFFSIKINKKSKIMKKYTIQKDWGLYDADELCKKLNKINLNKYLQSSAQQNQGQEFDPTKKSQIQKIAQILINFQKGIEDQDEQIQQLPYPDFDDQSVFWFKTRYHQYKSYNSLKKFIQKIKFDFKKFETKNETLPEILTSSIEMSLTEKHLQQKICLLIRQGFDFHICKKQVNSIERQKKMTSSERHLQQFKHTPGAEIKDEKLKEIIERMIERKLSFMMALIYCKEGEEKDLDYVWRNKEQQAFRKKIGKYIKQRGSQSPRLPSTFSYPYQPVEPIPFHTFIKLQQFTQDVNFEKSLPSLLAKDIFDNFFMNINSKIMQFEHAENIKFKKDYIQEQKRQQTKQLVKYWQKWHQYIKERFGYSSRIETIFDQLKRYQNNLRQPENKKLKKPEVPLQDPLEMYYYLTGIELILKYHRSRLDLSEILAKLSIQQVFVIDCLTECDGNEFDLIMIYKMQAEQNPYRVFNERMSINTLSKPLKNTKQHKDIEQIFISQLERMTLGEFSSIIEFMKECFLVPIWNIFKNIQDEKKQIHLLQHALQSSKPENKEKFTPQYILSLINYDKPYLTITILLLVDKQQFKLTINQQIKNHTKRLSTDNVSFYHQCQFDTFMEIVELMQKYYVINSKYVQEKVVLIKIRQITVSLISARMWNRVQLLLKMKNFAYMDAIVKCSFQEIGLNLLSIKKSLNDQNHTKTFTWIIDKLFELFKTLIMSFDEKVFVHSFLCNPQKSFDIMNPSQLRIQTFVTCLKAHPQEAKRFLTHEITVNTQNKPDRGYFQHNFPLTPYYYDKFGNNPWMLDLLRVERKLLSAFDELKRLDKTMQSLILLDKMDANFDEFYTQQEIQLKCSKLLTSNSVKSIKKYPQKWFDDYFAKHALKNLSILTKQLLIELIDIGYVKKEHIFKIISTCKLNVIKYFFGKYQITLNLQTILQIQSNYLDQKYKNNIWQLLSSIENEQFVIEFIQQYNLFEVCPVESYDHILLTNIAIHKSIKLLKFLLQHLTKKANRDLEFVFNKQGKIQNYLVTLPQEISVTMNFYEYYFLVKKSLNQCPDFYVSSRFLINNDNFEKQLQNYNFIPEMKRRLQILNVLCSVPSINRDMNWKQKILLKQIFNLHNNPQNFIQINANLSTQRNWINFIKYLVDQNIEVFQNENIDSLISAVILYLGTSETGISVDQIGKLYPNEIEIIKKVDKFLKKDANASKFAFNIIKNDSRLKALLLTNNFRLFMKNFESQLQLISNFDDALLYMEGIIANLKTFEIEKEYRKYLAKFLDLCFISQHYTYLQSSNYSLYLKKKILSLFLISFCEGNKFTFYHLCNILGLGDQETGHILYLVATKANEVSVRKKFEPSFDARSWNSVIEEISRLKFPLNQDRKDFDLEKIVEQSLSRLEHSLSENFQMKIKNLQQIITKSIQKVQSQQKSNILYLITVLINQTYILHHCFELYRSLKDAKIIQGNVENTNQSESLEHVKMNMSQVFCEKISLNFDTQKFDLKLSSESDQKMAFTIPYSWAAVQSDLPLIHLDITDTLNRTEKQILIHKLTLNPNIEVLNKTYENLQESLFKNMKFKFDVESLKKIKSGQQLKKIVEYLPITDNGISQVEKILSKIDGKAFNDKSIPYYSFSDVSGPIKLSQEENHEKVIESISFYELLELPSRQVSVQYLEKKPTEKQINEKCVEDFFKYIDYVSNEVKDTHPDGDILNSYKFSNKIQLFINEQTFQISTYTQSFSLANILQCLSLVSGASDERRRIFQNKIDVRYDVVSVIKIYQRVNEVSLNLKEKLKNEEIFTFLSTFLRCQQTTKLIDKILLLIIEDAINIMKVLKGALISFSINKNKQKLDSSISKRYWLNESVSVNLVTYQIQNQILRIMIDVDINSEKKQKEQVNFIGVQDTTLVSRSSFLESIFSSTEFLTDYFLEKGTLDTQCIKVSRSLSQKLNMTLNVHINYKSLYGFIDSIKKDLPIKQIDNHLYTLRMYLLVNLETRLLEHFTSTQIQESHHSLLISIFQVLHNELKKGNDQILISENLYKAVDEFENDKILSCKCDKNVKNVKSLQLLEGYGQKVENFNDFGKNVFLIQVFKNYFTTLVRQGMAFVIGFKDSSRQPTMIKFVKRQDIDKININEISYILLVGQQIPTNDELDHKKIIRVFITDMYKNVYKVSQIVKDHLLRLEGDDEELRNINNLVPVVQKNVVVDFDNANKLIAPHLKVPPKRGLKIFEIKLTKQPKFKLIPKKQQSMQLKNHLMKHIELNKQIDRFVQKMKTQWESTNFQLLIDCLNMGTSGLNYDKVTQTLKNYMIDIETALDYYLQNAQTNSELDYIASVLYGTKIQRNITALGRKETFLKCFKKIRFLLTNTKYPNVTIVGDEIHFEVSVNAQQYLKPRQILQEILKVELDKEINSKSIYECYYDVRIDPKQKLELSRNDMIKCIDIINMMSVQRSEIQNASNVNSRINQKIPKTPVVVSYVLTKKMKSCIKYSDKPGDQFVVYFNIDNHECEFFTSSEVLMIMLNGFGEKRKEAQFAGQYDLQQKAIKVYGAIKKQYLLVVDRDGCFLDCQTKVNSLNQTTGLIPISSIGQLFDPQFALFRFWLIDLKDKQVYDNFIYSIKQDQSKIVREKLSSVGIDEQIEFIVKQTKQNEMMIIEKFPITMSLLEPNDKNPRSYQSILKKDYLKYFKMKMISREAVRLTLTFNKAYNVWINLSTFRNVFDITYRDAYQIVVSSMQQAVIENTKFVEVLFRNKIHESKEIKQDNSKQNHYKKVFLEPAEKELIMEKQEAFQQQAKRANSIESLVYVVNNQSKNYLTRAGQKRVDYIQVCDAGFNPIEYKGEINIYFKHINNLCKIIPEIERKGTKIGLNWIPTIRGHYKVYFNGICLNPDYEIGVCAAVVDLKSTIMQAPKVKKICFYEETQCTFNLKDTFGNIYTELQQDILGDGLIIDIESDNEEINKFLKKKQEPINKYGVKRVRFSIDNSDLIESVKIAFSVYLNKQKISDFQIMIEGQSLQKRRKNFQTEIDAMNKIYSKEISVSRQNFLQSLFKIAEKSLVMKFSVKFSGEMGIDAGGLKRQFYDLIGNEMKSDKNPFFKPTDSRKIFYFINPDLLKNKKKQEYMELFGKYLANSILNGYLIGINFSPVFIKLLYNDPIEFSDLLEILPENEAKTYKYLTTASADEFEDLEIYFTTIINKKKGLQVQLKENGANIQVTHENVQEYLDLLTKVLIKNRYEEVIGAFVKGFESVISLNMLKKWIKANEFWCLTQGTKEINAQMVLNYVIFTGKADQSIISWFKRYINESNIQVLEGFLKFASGSSSIDFDQTSKITVAFQNAGENTKKLPISHTCWKQIVIPKYKSYEIMHKLLDAAFIFCSEGFGFG